MSYEDPNEPRQLPLNFNEVVFRRVKYDYMAMASVPPTFHATPYRHYWEMEKEDDEKRLIDEELNNRVINEKLTKEVTKLSHSVHGNILPLMKYVQSERPKWELEKVKVFIEDILIAEGLMKRRVTAKPPILVRTGPSFEDNL